MLATTIDVDMPEDFPTNAYNKIQDFCSPKVDSHIHKAPWAEWAGAWNGVAYRYAFVRDYDDS